MIEKIKNSGFALMAISMFLYSCCEAIEKFLTNTYAPSNIIFMRSSFGLLVVIGFIFKKGIRDFKKHLFLNIIKNIFGAIALIFSIYSLKNLPLSTYEFIVFLSPMIISFLAFIFLKEKGSYFILISLIVGFLGSIIILYPFQDSNLNIGFLFALLSCIFYSLSVFFTKKIAHLNYLTLYSMYIIVCFLLNGFLSFKNFSMNLEDLPIFFSVAIIHFLAFYLYVLALRKEDLMKLSPLEYSTVIWSILFGYMIWNYIPHLKEIIGGSLILGASVLLKYQDIKRYISLKTRNMN